MPRKTIPGFRFEDKSGAPFMVLLVEPEDLETPEQIEFALLHHAHYEFRVVLATPSGTGRHLFFGEPSLMDIARAKIGANPSWQKIPIHMPPHSI